MTPDRPARRSSDAPAPSGLGVRLLGGALFATVAAVIGAGFLAPWLLHLTLMRNLYGLAEDPALRDLSFPCPEDGSETVRVEDGKTLIYEWRARISRGCVPTRDGRPFAPAGDEERVVTFSVVTPFIRGASIGLFASRTVISEISQWPGEDIFVTASRVVTPGGRDASSE
ncbi:MAG: hypothetical protein DI629_20225 [Mesorhizobium amorphae]|nr:MAG: hypothetical protein DI629_20225 [Mesorhizobium amorphae]